MGAVASVPTADILNQSPFAVLPGQTGALHSQEKKGLKFSWPTFPQGQAFHTKLPQIPSTILTAW